MISVLSLEDMISTAGNLSLGNLESMRVDVAVSRTSSWS
jgi:hypothetical protein